MRHGSRLLATKSPNSNKQTTDPTERTDPLIDCQVRGRIFKAMSFFLSLQASWHQQKTLNWDSEDFARQREPITFGSMQLDKDMEHNQTITVNHI